MGAGLHWDDPQYGEGRVRILVSESGHPGGVLVLVEGGSLEIQGCLLPRPAGAGTRLHWVETGDFGWNPLMGYAARGMAASQA